jgi:hypothetical protein
MNDINEGNARDGLLVRMAMLVPPIISSMEGMISSRKTFFHNIRLLIDQDPPIRLNDPVVGMYKHHHDICLDHTSRMKSNLFIPLKTLKGFIFTWCTMARTSMKRRCVAIIYSTYVHACSFHAFLSFAGTHVRTVFACCAYIAL